MTDGSILNATYPDWVLHGANTSINVDRPDNPDYLPSETNHYETGWSNYYDDYSYFSSEIHEEFLRNIHNNTSVFAVALSVWSLIINCVIIWACTCNTEIRRNGYYNQIVNLSISNLLISVFVIPLTVYHIQHAWDLGQALCKIYIISDVLLPFTSLIIIIILNLDRMLSIIHPKLHSWIFQKGMKCVVLCTPWCTSLIIVIPIWTSGTIPYENAPGECMVLISRASAILCPLVTYFFPTITLITFTFKLLLLKLSSSTHRSVTLENSNLSLRTCKNHHVIDMEDSDTLSGNSPPSGTTSAPIIYKEKRDDITSLCVVNTSFTIMWFPFQCISFLLSFCHTQDCIPSIGLNQVVTWLGASTAGIVPIFWFIDSQLRRSIQRQCVKPQHDELIESSNSEETFL